MHIDWNSLNTFEDYAGVLGQLINAGSTAVEHKDLESRDEIAVLLSTFQRKTAGADFGDLDSIARRTIQNLALETVSQVIAELVTRDRELRHHLESVRHAAGLNQRRTSPVRLEPLNKAITALSGATSNVSQIVVDVRGRNGAEEVAKSAEKIISSIQRLQTQLRNLAGTAPMSFEDSGEHSAVQPTSQTTDRTPARTPDRTPDRTPVRTPVGTP